MFRIAPLARLVAGVLLGLLSHISALPASAEVQEFQFKYFEITEGRIAFSYIDGDKRDIYVLDFKDLNVTPVVTSKALDEAPSFSPDGKKIVFHSDMTGDREIFVVNYDGSDLMQLTNSKGADEDPSFSPDGKKIVFQSSRGGEGSQIYVMEADGTKQVPLVDEPARSVKNVTPRYSPRANELLYVTNAQWPGWDILLFDLASKETKTLTQGLGSYIRPAWKPDGGSFAFAYGSGNDIDIWEAEKGKSAPVPVVRREGRELDPCWSDDGRMMFFSGEAAPGQNDYQLFVYDTNPAKGKKSGEPIQILQSRGSIRHPSWTPFPTIAQLAAELKKKQGARPPAGAE